MMDRRTAIGNHMIGACASPLAFAAADACAQEADATGSSSAPPMATPNGDSIGVLWRTNTRVALPATPKVLAQITQKEMLSALSTDSTGIVCISERHDDFEHHKVQLKILMTIKKALQERAQNVKQKLAIGMEMFQRKD